MEPFPLPSAAIQLHATTPAPAIKPTLLLVDDEERVLRSLKMVFAVHYRVLATTRGAEALNLLQTEHVHVLVSDQRMPEMTGVELLREARVVSPGTMRLLLTGYSDLEAIVGSINDGEIFRYLNKPWSPAELRTVVASAAEIAVKLEQIGSASSTDSAASGERQTVLLIDDDPKVASHLKTLLEENPETHCTLEWVSDMDSACRVLESKRVALVISELRLAGQDMSPFIKALKQMHPEVVTIVLSAFQDAGLLVELVNQGQVHRFLPKPLRHTMTVRGISSGLHRSRELRVAPGMALRHQVEQPARVDPSLLNRVRGFFRGLAAR